MGKKPNNSLCKTCLVHTLSAMQTFNEFCEIFTSVILRLADAVLVTELWFRFPEIHVDMGNVSTRKTNNVHKCTQHKIHYQNTSNKHVTNTGLGRLDRSISIVHERYSVSKTKWTGSFLTWSFLLNMCGLLFGQCLLFLELNFLICELNTSHH